MSISRDSMIRIASGATTAVPDHLESRFGLQQPGDALAEQRVVINKQQADIFCRVLFIGAIFLVKRSGQTDRKTAAFPTRLELQIPSGAS